MVCLIHSRPLHHRAHEVRVGAELRVGAEVRVVRNELKEAQDEEGKQFHHLHLHLHLLHRHHLRRHLHHLHHLLQACHFRLGCERSLTLT